MSYLQIADCFAWLRKGSLAALLGLLVMSVFGVPLLTEPGSFAGRVTQDALFSLILMAGVVTSTERPGSFPLIAFGAFTAIAVRCASWLFPGDYTLAIRDETALAAVALIGTTIGMTVFGPGKVTFGRIDGAIALYILIGMICAYAYQLINLRVPNAFSGVTIGTDKENPSTWIYFSFVTLTTAGYGDIVPIARQARSIANLEGLIGQLYPAIVLARLVSLHLANSGADKA
ncbi:potassium channel family protein [Paraburkholderia sp. J94]|uniref:potassium channel family protein n=1 Tax=Paraburkholderia sp. J94 TaxID=2805441 RepID=UPI002AB1ED26|nr:potassium channel family protein [Paraburkholderia sp. J94]